MQVLAGLLALLPVVLGDLMKTDRVQPATIPQYVALLRCMKSCLDQEPAECMQISFNEILHECERYNQSYTGDFAYDIVYNRTVSNETCPNKSTIVKEPATTPAKEYNCTDFISMFTGCSGIVPCKGCIEIETEMNESWRWWCNDFDYPVEYKSMSRITMFNTTHTKLFSIATKESKIVQTSPSKFACPPSMTTTTGMEPVTEPVDSNANLCKGEGLIANLTKCLGIAPCTRCENIGKPTESDSFKMKSENEHWEWECTSWGEPNITLPFGNLVDAKEHKNTHLWKVIQFNATHAQLNDTISNGDWMSLSTIVRTGTCPVDWAFK